ncbi:glycosyltransferase involved in cell wall biosynthesis [Dietzia kunjamensis]|uniref:glycosyltransferase family 4 protein n=1 Tax=Dietzia kunjamensis TaxID=322509 RepID=UPI000E7635C2|nr:glycosyltransferase family 4 protein [Dietzia kunjamensis]MBB1012575.1 glycosyltransferase family 4 protein [Dietzia kunjamensis]RKE59500.1 glycosyltransferase involved in cell wall biosynthesis [Dietzia kunjamensis]
MRISYVQQHFVTPDEPGGVRGWEFCHRLASMGHSVTVFRGGHRAGSEIIRGVRVVTFSVRYDNAMGFAERIASFLSFVVRATFGVLHARPQMVYASSTPLTVIVPGLIAKVFLRSRLVFEVRDLWPEVPAQLGLVGNKLLIRGAELLANVGYRFSDLVIALSPYMEKGVRSASPSAAVLMIPNGCDLDQFENARRAIQMKSEPTSLLREDGEEMTLVYAGGFGWLYEVEWGVRLAASLADSGIGLKLIGDGADSESARELAIDLGLDPEDIFVGRLSKADVVTRLIEADCVLSMLRDEPILEGCSLNKVFDALAAGRPIVANHGGWQMDEAVEWGAGLIVDRDLTKAAPQIIDFMKNTVLQERAGAASLELARERYSRSDQFEALYQGLVRHGVVSNAL